MAKLGFIGKDEANSVTTVGAAAVQLNANEVLLTGGVNKDIFFDAISGAYKMVEKQNYLKQPVEWYRFNGTPYAFQCEDQQLDRNQSFVASFGSCRCTNGLCKERSLLYWGELKPGVRSPQVSKITWE